MSRVNSIYLVCECGFFYGDMRLYEDAGIDCPECLRETAAAFAALGDALAHQEQIKAASRAENGHSRRQEDQASRPHGGEDTQAREGAGS